MSLQVNKHEEAVNLFLYHFEKNNGEVAQNALDNPAIPAALKEKIRRIIAEKPVADVKQDLKTKIAAIKVELNHAFQSSDPKNIVFQDQTLTSLILSHLKCGKEVAKTVRTSQAFKLATESDEIIYFQLESITSINFDQLEELSQAHGMSYSEIIGYCTNLKKLSLSCSHINDVQLSAILKKVSPMLQDLYLSECPNLQNAPDLTNCLNLQVLSLSGCENLQNSPNLINCRNLQELYLKNCINLQNPPNLTNCTNLKELRLNGCINLLENLPDVSNCTDLHRYIQP